MKRPQLNKEYKKLNYLLQQLQKKHEESLTFWNAYIADSQNCLLLGDIKGLRAHLKWMSDVSSDFRNDILKTNSEFATIKSKEY